MMPPAGLAAAAAGARVPLARLLAGRPPAAAQLACRAAAVWGLPSSPPSSVSAAAAPLLPLARYLSTSVRAREGVRASAASAAPAVASLPTDAAPPPPPPQAADLDAPAGAARRRDAPDDSPLSLFGMYAELCKARLSSLVVMTTGAGFLMAGAPASWLACAAATVGTSLAAGAAGTFNQVWETSNDMAMKRTQRRPLPSGRISKPRALAFGAGLTTASAGVLLAGTNPLTAALGLGNIVLYALVYTPLKTRSELNTAVGALVGAIPPVMGWVAATGSSVLAPEPLLLALLLFWWQFPHFYSLAFTHRRDYARGGFAMVPVVDGGDGKRAAWYALRSALALAALPPAAAALGVVNPMFAVEGLVLNGYFVALAARFWRDPTDATARPLFRTSLWYLPLLLGLMVFHSVHWDAAPEGEADAAAAAVAAAAGGGARATLEPPTTTTTTTTTTTVAAAAAAAVGGTLHAHPAGGTHHGEPPLPSRALQAVVSTAKDAGRALCLHESALVKDGGAGASPEAGGAAGGAAGAHPLPGTPGGATDSLMRALCPVQPSAAAASPAAGGQQQAPPPLPSASGDAAPQPPPATGCPITAVKAVVGAHTRALVPDGLGAPGASGAPRVAPAAAAPAR